MSTCTKIIYFVTSRSLPVVFITSAVTRPTFLGIHLFQLDVPGENLSALGYYFVPLLGETGANNVLLCKHLPRKFARLISPLLSLYYIPVTFSLFWCVYTAGEVKTYHECWLKIIFVLNLVNCVCFQLHCLNLARLNVMSLFIDSIES